jgi:hypothetical protein
VLEKGVFAPAKQARGGAIIVRFHDNNNKSANAILRSEKNHKIMQISAPTLALLHLRGYDKPHFPAYFL